MFKFVCVVQLALTGLGCFRVLHALKLPAAAGELRELPQCSKDAAARFSSLDEAVDIGLAAKGSVPEDKKRGSTQSCCGWWKASAPPASAKSLLMLGDSSRGNACVASYPITAHRSQSAAKRDCGDVAITVGGTFARKWELRKYLNYIKKYIVDGFKVDFYFHIGYSGGRHGNEVTGYTEDQPPWTELPHLPPSVRELVVEDASDERIHQSVVDCTQNVSDAWVEKLHRRFPGTDQGEYSSVYMYRHIFLAHRMARESKCPYKVMMRARPAFSDTPDWEALSTAVAKGTVFTGIKKFILKEMQVDAPNRCELDDTFAWGTPETMDEYSVLYPDFKNVIPFYPFYRDDAHHYVNERVLATHLHYRGLDIGHWGYDYDLGSILTLPGVPKEPK